jgi:hypothetical protein
MKQSKEETLGKINGIMNHDIDVELTIWGASTAYVNFNPKIIIDSLEISSMNMGIDGTNIDQYAGLLNEYIDYTIESKYLIIALDIHSGLTNRKTFYHMYKWLHHIKNDNIYNCLSDIDNKTMLKLKYLPFYKLTHFDKHSFPYFRRTILNKESNYQISNFGFRPLENTSIYQSNNNSTFKTLIGERSLNKVKDAVIRATKKGIKCYVVITPCFEKGLSQISNRNEFISNVKTIGIQHAEVIDFSNCYLSKKSKYFKDNTHLNAMGADELTKLLIKEIKPKHLVSFN